MTTTDVDFDVDVPEDEPDPDHVCSNCGEDMTATWPSRGCYCWVCPSCENRVEYICESCARCEGCCECMRCDNCEEMYRSVCPDCDCCGDCCGCHEGSDLIENYSYSPSPLTFHSVQEGRIYADRSYRAAPDDQAYMGLEIETEAVHGSPKDIARVWLDSGFGYAKEDGSLSDGVECVTHPHTYAALKHKDRLATTLGQMSKAGARAWGTSTCGLHIHVSRKTFAQRSHLWRFCSAITSLREPLVRLAGRDGGQWCSWDTDDGDGYRRGNPSPTKIVAGKAYQATRYVAVNLENTYTVELRFWRGSINPVHVLGAAAITDALVKWTRVMPFRTVRAGLTWDGFMSWAADHVSPEQYADIAALADRRHLTYPTKGEATACAS